MAQPGVETGDVVFILRLQPHDRFHRAPSHSQPSLSFTSAPSADLFTTVHLTLSEALLGFSRIILRHLDGRGIYMSRQASSDPYLDGQGLPVRPGEVVVIRDEGMPVYDPARIKKRNAKGKAGNDDDIEKGDLYINFEIEMPSQEWMFNINTKVRFVQHVFFCCSFSCTSPFLYSRIIHGSFREMHSTRPSIWRLAGPCISQRLRFPSLRSSRLCTEPPALETLDVSKQAGDSQVAVHSVLSAHIEFIAGHGIRLPAASTYSFWSSLEWPGSSPTPNRGVPGATPTSITLPRETNSARSVVQEFDGLSSFVSAVHPTSFLTAHIM